MKTLLASLLAAGALLALAFASETTRDNAAATDVPAPETAEPVRLNIELDRPVLPADSRETAIVKVSLRGAPVQARAAKRAPVNLALVIDKSGSMSGEKIVRAREAALEAVSRLSPDDVVALVVYDSTVRTLVPARRVGDGEALRAAIEEISADGGTALHGGVMAGAAELRRRIEEPYTHRIVLLSDGQANVGPQTPEALGSLGARLLREGISVTTIGLGLDYNEDLMTRLARRSDGNTYFVEHGRDLARIFREELGDVLSVVARRVEVEVEFPEDVRPVRIVGREGVVDGRRARVELNQLYGGQEKFALVEVEVAPGRAGGARELAQARVRFEDAVDARPAARAARLDVRFSEAREDVVAAVNKEVQVDYAANRLAEAKDEAVQLVDAGQKEEAARRLRGVSASLGAAGAAYGNAGMSAVAAPAARAAERIETGDFDAALRKQIRAEVHQVTNQQRAE